MIIRWRHDGLERLFTSGNASGVAPDLVKRLKARLATLAAAKVPQAMNIPGYRLHPLSGDLKGYWSVTVSGNWRLIFRFDGEDATDVDLVDYH
jgi:proteic killer suppression protein